MHDSLCDATQLLNSAFSMQLLTLIGSLILFNVICFFEICHNARKDSLTFLEIFYSVSDIIWVMFDSFFIFAVVINSYLMSKNAYRTPSLMHNIQNNTKNSKNCEMVSSKYKIKPNLY